ncbi:hypothetical protein JYT79_01465 [Cardiobacterium sp. AH-315-I02]|nr:hypothetical protein [Cardiobacterium sp. AH-315-I02]
MVTTKNSANSNAGSWKRGFGCVRVSSASVTLIELHSDADLKIISLKEANRLVEHAKSL